jgi:aspartyl/asparaginyl-tRNA synthetase
MAFASQQHHLAHGTHSKDPAEGLFWDVTTFTVKLHWQSKLWEQDSTYVAQDTRGDRQPSFTQMDLEMTFADQDVIMQLTEALMRNVFQEVTHRALKMLFRTTLRCCGAQLQGQQLQSQPSRHALPNEACIQYMAHTFAPRMELCLIVWGSQQSILNARHVREPCLPVLTRMLEYSAMLAMVQVMGVQLPEQFPRMTYAQAMDRYGCDKPDVRYELHMQDVTDVVQDCSLRYLLDLAQIGNEHGVHHTPCCPLDSASTFDCFSVQPLSILCKMMSMLH